MKSWNCVRENKDLEEKCEPNKGKGWIKGNVGWRHVSLNTTTPLAEFIAKTFLEGNLATWSNYS